MMDFLKKDLSLKILSVLLAIILWFIVSNSVNPLKQTRITVPLAVINKQVLADKGIVITNEKYTKNVILTVEARENIIQNLTSNDFLVNLDLSKVKSVSDTEIAVDAPTYIGDQNKNDIKITGMEPSTIKVELGKQAKNAFKVDVVTVGEPKRGYKIVEKTVEPEMILVEALDSQLGTIDSIKAVIDVTNIDKDTVIKKDCTVYDKKGNEIPALSKNLSVDVKLKVAKQVLVEPDLIGSPQDNYTQSSTRVYPETVLITGLPEILDKIDSIKTESVSIQNINQSMETTKKLKLPEGVKLYTPIKDVTVSVSIEQYSNKDITVSSKDITMINKQTENSYNYSITTSSILINLRGFKSDINTLDAAAIKPYIDVKGLGPGEYKLPLKAVLPGNVYISQDYMIDLKVETR